MHLTIKRMFSKTLKLNDPKENIKRMKYYLELFNSKNIEKDFGMKEIKNFLILSKVSKEYIDSGVNEAKELKLKINEIISLNKSIDENENLTKFSYNTLQREKNDFIFKSLLSNNFSLINKGDVDSTILEYLPSLAFNLKTINPVVILKSELLLDKLKTICKDLTSFENYKGVSSEHVACFFNTLLELGINIINEDSFKFHSKIILEENCDHLEYFTVYDYFTFFLNFKDILNIKQILQIKENFKKYFNNKIIQYIKNENENMNILQENLFRYDEIYVLMKNYNSDPKFIITCEYLLHIKLKDDICPIDTLLDFTHFYVSNSNKTNKTFLHFLIFNLLEHLKSRIKIKTFEHKLIPLFEYISLNFRILGDSETLKEFLEELKSCIYFNKFIENQIELVEDLFNNENSISFESMFRISTIYKNFQGSEYYDEAFSNYLNKYIKLNKSLLLIY